MHNIAITCLLSRVTGITFATIMASYISSIFPLIRFKLMIRVSGGALSAKNNI